MSENEIPLGSNDTMMPDFYYRVSIVSSDHYPEHGSPKKLISKEDFKDPDLLMAKQKALAFLTETLDSYLEGGKEVFSNNFGMTPLLNQGNRLKYQLSLIKCENDITEEFYLIGAPTDQKLEARMEEEVAMAIHRINNHKVR
jgi:hypothetical protein